MGVSTTGESGETFPTRIFTLEIYWGISPVKIRFRPEIDPLTFEVLFYVHKIWPLPKNSGRNPQNFQFLVGDTYRFQLSGDFWNVPGFPSSLEAADPPLAKLIPELRNSISKEIS